VVGKKGACRYLRKIGDNLTTHSNGTARSVGITFTAEFLLDTSYST
jgi:hypothetical protein